jgi:hypothetical protein
VDPLRPGDPEVVPHDAGFWRWAQRWSASPKVDASVHTFRLINEEGKSTFVKYHWQPHLGTHSLVWDEALKVSCGSPSPLWVAAADSPAQRTRPRFPSTRPLGRHRGKGLSQVGPRRSTRQGGGRAQGELLAETLVLIPVRLRLARLHQAHPRGARAGAVHRHAHAQP